MGSMGKIIRFRKEDRVRIRYILAAAIITTVILMLLVRIGTMAAGSGVRNTEVIQKNGSYNLTGITDWDRLLVSLPPGTQYYPGVLLTPDTIDSVLPEAAEQLLEYKADYLTQRFLVEVPDDGQVYTLTFKVHGRHAMKVYINGKIAGQSGNPGTTKKTTEIGENNLVFYGTARDGKMDIILQCSQFYHYKYQGAKLATLYFNKAVKGFDAGFSSESRGFFIMGGLLGAAALLLILFFMNRAVSMTLYFSLACISMAVRECIQSQVWTKLPFLGGGLSFVLEYLSVVLITVFLTLYLGQLLTGHFWQIIRSIVLAASALYGLCLLGDSIFYTSVLKYYQVILIFCIIIGVTGLFRVMSQPRLEQAVSLYGIAVFYLAAVSDILMYMSPSQLVKDSVSEAAMLVFVLAQTVSLFLMNNRILAQAREEERRLEGEKETLEKVNRLKTELMGNVSHELKTPLTVISSYAQYTRGTLEDREDNREARKNMKLIESEADRLAMMVSQILDVTRIEENRLDIICRPCSLTGIIQYTLDTYYPVFSKNGNRLEFHPYRGTLTVSCDADRITQVLVNLISNAARHTREGKITVETGEKGAFAEIKITDTGSGMEKERVERLFERYYTGLSGEGNSTAPRGDGTEEPESAAGSPGDGMDNKDKKPEGRRETGTGLGLYVCRHIIREHGGNITVESEPGMGTTVLFTLPLCL